jgi:hypothetical protein
MHCVGSPALEQPITITSDRGTGLTVERRWIGIHAAVLGQMQIESGFADAVRFESFGATASLTARYGTPQDGASEILTTAFEMRGEEVTQSIWKHPNFSGVSKQTQKAISDAINSSDNYEVGEANIDNIAADNGDNSAVVHAAYNLMIEDTQNYLVPQSYVFIRTRTGSRNYEAVLEFTGDGKIWSSAQVALYVGDSAPFNVPQLDAVANSQALRLAFGWRKRSTEVVRISNGNQQITESWQSARWTMLLYDAL